MTYQKEWTDTEKVIELKQHNKWIFSAFHHYTNYVFKFSRSEKQHKWPLKKTILFQKVHTPLRNRKFSSQVEIKTDMY